MKFFYTEDLDELIIYRSDEFIEDRLPSFTVSEIDEWNKYNEDMQIISFSDVYTLDKTVEEFLYNKAEGHHIDYRIIYKKVSVEDEPYILMSRIPMIENKDLFWNLITQYGLIFIILLVSLGIAQRIVSKKLWAPFYGSLDKIENYNLEQDHIPEFEKTDIVEFSRLNEMLTNLISNNLRIYKQQKEFIENASHELQTPLAVFQSQLDILLQDQELTEKQMNIIQSLYTISSRLTRLNKNLLLLAKIDNAYFREVQEIDFVDLLNTSVSYFKELAENEGMQLTTEICNPLLIEANKILLESLVNNFIVNALKHNINNGLILIVVKDATFVVSNTGDNKPLDKDKIFRRFSRTSEEKKGNGLGLSIIYQICKFHGWDISYKYESERHTFAVRFISENKIALR